MIAINGWHLLACFFAIFCVAWIGWYAMPPSSQKGRWIAEVWSVNPMTHGTNVRWRRRYTYRWMAAIAAKHQARRMDHFDIIHWEFGIDWGVRKL